MRLTPTFQAQKYLDLIIGFMEALFGLYNGLYGLQRLDLVNFEVFFLRFQRFFLDFRLRLYLMLVNDSVRFCNLSHMLNKCANKLYKQKFV